MKTETIERAFILDSNASITTLHDAYNERFEKLTALIHISLCSDFGDFPKKTIYHYLAVISDTMDELRDLQLEITQKSIRGINK